MLRGQDFLVMTGHYENFSRLDGSFELRLKAKSAWEKTTKNMYKVQLYFQKLKEKLAYRYFSLDVLTSLPLDSI